MPTYIDNFEQLIKTLHQRRQTIYAESTLFLQNLNLQQITQEDLNRCAAIAQHLLQEEDLGKNETYQLYKMISLSTLIVSNQADDKQKAKFAKTSSKIIEILESLLRPTNK